MKPRRVGEISGLTFDFNRVSASAAVVCIHPEDLVHVVMRARMSSPNEGSGSSSAIEALMPFIVASLPVGHVRFQVSTSSVSARRYSVCISAIACALLPSVEALMIR